MKHIAIILARGGSKRLPRKNILDFHGKPLLAWTIEAALKSEQYDRVLVSTDDYEISEIAKAFGAEVPFLRKDAADDTASSSEATIVALKQAEDYWGEQFEYVSQLMANCPLRDAVDINLSVKNFTESGGGSQISCFRFGWMNPWWAAKLDRDGVPEFVFPEALTSRSQDLPNLYCPSGAIWLSKRDNLMANKTFYAPHHIFFPLNWVSAMDVDDAEDFEMAKACFLIKNHRF